MATKTPTDDRIEVLFVTAGGSWQEPRPNGNGAMDLRRGYKGERHKLPREQAERLIGKGAAVRADDEQAVEKAAAPREREPLTAERYELMSAEQVMAHLTQNPDDAELVLDLEGRRPTGRRRSTVLRFAENTAATRVEGEAAADLDRERREAADAADAATDGALPEGEDADGVPNDGR